MEGKERMECDNPDHKNREIIFDDIYHPVTLSQLTTNKGEILAQAMCSGEGSKRYNKNDVFILAGISLMDKIRREGKIQWKGDPFESVKFEDFGKNIIAEKVPQKEDSKKEEKLNEEKPKKSSAADLIAALNKNWK